MEKKSGRTVCVTGGAGFIGSWLVKKLLEKGHTVHATLRNLEDRSKVEVLKSFQNAETGLVLFKADINDPESFDHVIQGCEYVFHVATPLIHSQGSKFKSTSEAAIAAVKSIASSCVKSGTVRRLIYTASVVAASPMKEDGSGFKDFIDETCWSSLNVSFPFSSQSLKDYKDSKLLSEKEILRFGESSCNGGIEAVSLTIGLVGGASLTSHPPLTTMVTLSQFLDSSLEYTSLRLIKELVGKIPLIHIEDACNALIFCMDQTSINGRFLCASSYVSTEEIARYILQKCPDVQLKHEEVNSEERDIKWSSTKLIDKGFIYNYDTNMILDDCFKVCKDMMIIL